MTIDQGTGNAVLSALLGANFPERVVLLSMAQAGAETATKGQAFTSNLFVNYNNGSGITWGGSDEQAETGAYDSGVGQPDGDLNYAAYWDLDSWARDFYRILSFDKGAGAPIDADNATDYVTRLKANGYFGAPVNVYLANLLKNYQQVTEQFSTEAVDTGYHATDAREAAAKVLNDIFPGTEEFFEKKDWLIMLAVLVIIGLLVGMVYYINRSSKMRVAAFIILFLGMSAVTQAQGLSPLPPPNTAAYGRTPATTYSPQLSILDSLGLGPGLHVNMVSGSVTTNLRQGTQDSNKVYDSTTAVRTTAIATTSATTATNTTAANILLGNMYAKLREIDSFTANQGCTVEGMAIAGTFNVPIGSLIIGGYVVGGGLLTNSDITGTTATEKGFILGSVPAQVPMQSFKTVASAHTVTGANAAGIIVFILKLF
jgi:hypothetical protein